MTLFHGEVRIPLSRQQGCEVGLCEHGLLHVRIEGVTAHITRESFEHLCSALLAARRRLTAGEIPQAADCAASG